MLTNEITFVRIAPTNHPDGANNVIASPIVPGALYRVSGHPTFVCATNGAHAIAKVLEQRALAADRAANVLSLIHI